MRELITRWAICEPSLCFASQVGDFQIFSKRWQRTTVLYLDDPEMAPELEATIQAAVQEAIEAGGYNWQLSKKGFDPSSKWQRFAMIWSAFGVGKTFEAFGLESSAEVLLEAYLQALEADA